MHYRAPLQWVDELQWVLECVKCVRDRHGIHGIVWCHCTTLAKHSGYDGYGEGEAYVASDARWLGCWKRHLFKGRGLCIQGPTQQNRAS